MGGWHVLEIRWVEAQERKHISAFNLFPCKGLTSALRWRAGVPLIL